MPKRVEEERPGYVAILHSPEIDPVDRLDLDIVLALWTFLTEYEEDEEVRVVILFWAGDDLRGTERPWQPRDATYCDALSRLKTATRRLKKPTIWASRGSALDEGFELLLYCDFVIAAERAIFGYRKDRMHFAPGRQENVLLARRISRFVAFNLAWGAESINTSRALQIGLINRVVVESEVLETAVVLATKISGNVPLAVRWSKRLVAEANEYGETRCKSLNNDALLQVLASSDAREGAAAFSEKRQPIWRGI